jgi:transcription-repair coupling factor (superfamily II helicase)
LEKAVRRLKQLPPRETLDVHIDLPGQAYLPLDYVPDLRAKIDLYRRLAHITSTVALDDFATELADRFGPRPAEVERLIWRARMRILAHRRQITSIHQEGCYLVLGFRSRSEIEPLVRGCRGRLRIVDQHSAYLPLTEQVGALEGPAKALESLLQQA